MPAPALPAGTHLQQISCIGAQWCLAAGFVLKSGGGTGASVAAILSGQTWRRVSVPSEPSSLDCTLTSRCEAMINGRPYGWNGRGWRAQPFTPPGAGGAVTSVSCQSASSCEAVGWWEKSPTGRPEPLAALWDGHAWTFPHVPEPRNGGRLNAVSCSSAGACTAVGFIQEAHASGLFFTRSLAARWTGTTWTLEHPPDPSDAIFGQLTNVACPSARECVAPSTYDDGCDMDGAFADVWQKGLWRMTPLHLPAAAVRDCSSEIDSVSCTSQTACVAVGAGGFEATDGQLVEVWNGDTWRDRRGPLPLPSDGAAGTGLLAAISCGSPTTCIGAGTYTTTSGAPGILIAERQTVG